MMYRAVTCVVSAVGDPAWVVWWFDHTPGWVDCWLGVSPVAKEVADANTQ